MSNISLNRKLVFFINERIEEEIYENDKYKNNIHDLKAIEIIEDMNNNLGEDNDICKIINKLRDLHTSELVDMMEVAYRIGFRDGLQFEDAMFNI